MVPVDVEESVNGAAVDNVIRSCCVVRSHEGQPLTSHDAFPTTSSVSPHVPPVPTAQHAAQEGERPGHLTFMCHHVFASLIVTPSACDAAEGSWESGCVEGGEAPSIPSDERGVFQPCNKTRPSQTSRHQAFTARPQPTK